jgi:1-acyl-sn-glycerol-3-phosphate acyltransferase
VSDRPRGLGWWLYQPWKWLVVAPLLAASTVFFSALVLLLLPFGSPGFVSRLCGGGWARFNAFMTPMRVRVRGREHLDPAQSYVIVCNHQSHYDVFVLYGWLGVDFKWVMKAELRRVPVLGATCARLGHVYIDRSNRAEALATLEAAKDRIRGGTSVLFFPEGTRSRSGELGEFKKGAFRMALDLGLPILPMTIRGTRDVLPAKGTDLRPGSATLTIHPPIPIDGCTTDDLTELMRRTRDVIASS